MHSIFIQYVYLILIILALVMIADKLRLAYPIVLLLGGLALSFTTQFSNITIDPELVFFIFLPCPSPKFRSSANIGLLSLRPDPHKTCILGDADSY
jgi:hypothetical protein